MNNNNEILDIKGLLDAVKGVISGEISRSGHNATGNAIKSLKTVISGDDGYIEGAGYMPFIEKGSKPKSIPYEKIHEWAKVKGIISGDDTESRRISGAIAHSIIKRGTKTYQIGGEDVWTGAISDFLDKHLDEYITIKQIENGK